MSKVRKQVLETFSAKPKATDKADAETEIVTQPEQTDVEDVHAAIDSIAGTIETLASKDDVEEAKRMASEVAEKYTASMEEFTSRLDTFAKNLTPITVVREEMHEYQKGLKGFHSFVSDVKDYGGKFTTAHPAPERMQTWLKRVNEEFGLNVSDDAQGGFTIPPEQVAEIMQLQDGSTTIIERTRNIPLTTNAITIVADDISSLASAGIAGGYQGHWIDEAQELTLSSGKFQKIQLNLHKLGALATTTNEFMKFSPLGAAQYIRDKFAKAIRFSQEEAIVRGTGAGQPLGILNDPAKVTADAESGQGANTIVFENILEMMTRFYMPLWGNAIWLSNTNNIKQLYAMSLAVGTGGSAVFLGGDIAGAPFGSIYGRPLIFHEHCSSLGTEGDLILVDLAQYWRATQGPELAESMHVYFTSDQNAFRIITFMDGKGWWKQAIQPVQAGDPTQSWVVTLNSSRT
jgi:HK97 family phage major capsid protein